MKKILILVFLVLFSGPFGVAKAADELSQVDYTANVISMVSAEKSQVTLNTQETFADPVNHPILLTVTLFNKDQKPLADKDVAVSSDRGKVDIIEPISKISSYQVHAATREIVEDQTDSSGTVQFRITSFIPGLAYLKITADGIVELPSETIKFTPLPFPAELVVSTSLLGTNKELTLYSSRIQEENLSATQLEAKRLANPGAKIKINFWAFALFLLLLIGMPIFLVLGFINLRKMRKYARRDSERLKLVLNKITSSQDVRSLQTEIHKDGLDGDR